MGEIKSNTEKLLQSYGLRMLLKELEREKELDWFTIVGYIERACLIGYDWLLNELYDNDEISDNTYSKYVI